MVAKTRLGSARIPPASECSCLLQTEQVDRRFIGPSLALEGTQNIGHLQIRLLSQPLEACSLVPRKKNATQFFSFVSFYHMHF